MELYRKSFGYAFISLINLIITTMTENDVIFNFILTNNEAEARTIFAEKGYRNLEHRELTNIVGFCVNTQRKTFFPFSAASKSLNSTGNLADLKEYL